MHSDHTMIDLHDPRSGVSRRELMRRVAGAGLGMGLGSALGGGAGRAAAGQQTTGAPYPNWNTELRQLAPNVYAYTQAGGPGVPSSAVSNGACIIGPDGWMAIDAFAAPPHAKAFLAAASKVTGGRPCSRLVNTHHHADHTTGNCFFLPAEIVAHEFCRQAVIKGGISNMEGRPESWKVGASELKLAPAVTTIDDHSKLTYYYGNTEVQLVFLGPAHTWGDIGVYLPQHKILWAGDVAFFYVSPASQSGHFSKWIEAINRINKMDVDIIVPGHGPIGTKKELSLMAEYLEFVKAEARKFYNAGVSPGRAAADIKMGKFESWADPAANRIVNHMVRLYAEFKGTIGPETDGPATREANAEHAALMKARAR